MPDIFSTNTKIKLIEYGSNQQGLESVFELKDKFVGFLCHLAHKAD